LGADELLVLVSERPGHRATVAPAEVRLGLARLAFPEADVRLDPHAFTVDFLRAEEPEDAVLVIGADQWAAFRTWKEPEEILRRIPVAVARRPGQPAPEGDVRVFEIDQHAVSSSEIRRRLAAGESVEGLVPREVALEIERRGLYSERGG
jgi:nicotinate-nucleotide adenylyltransferase